MTSRAGWRGPRRGGRELTPTEWGVLVALATVPGRVYSRYELINRVRGYEFEGYERTVDSHVKNLRRKIEADPASPVIIQTVLGGGLPARPDPGWLRTPERRRWPRRRSGCGSRWRSSRVALAAVALLAGLTAVFAAADVTSLAGPAAHELTRPSRWPPERPGSRARQLGRRLTCPPCWTWPTSSARTSRSATGPAVVVGASPGFTWQRGRSPSAPVVVRGQRVGTVMVRFTGPGLARADEQLQTALLRAIAGAAGLAALLALLAGTRRWPAGSPARWPALIAVARAMGGGDRTARAGAGARPGRAARPGGHLRPDGRPLDRQEQMRRDLVADVAHELRTPIAVLQAGHEALLDGVTEPTPAQLASLRDEVLRLARMVDDLQTLAAADAAALQLTLLRLRPGRDGRRGGRQPGRPVRGRQHRPGAAAGPGARSWPTRAGCIR